MKRSAGCPCKNLCKRSTFYSAIFPHQIKSIKRHLNLRLSTYFKALYQWFLKRPSHTRQTNVGQLVLANANCCVRTIQQHVGKLLTTGRTRLYFRQPFSNLLLCEGRLRLSCPSILLTVEKPQQGLSQNSSI